MWRRIRCGLITLGVTLLGGLPVAAQTAHCDIPREARDIWHCENGFVIGPENVIIRLPIPETDPEALYNAGIEAANREDWRVAIAYFTAAQQRAHLVPRYMYNLGLAHARAGHEVAAIAWLAAYLAAAPDAPNRAAVWQQVRELETTARRDIDVLWRRASAAADALPAAGEDSGMGPSTFFGRDAARAALAAARTRVGTVESAMSLNLLPRTGFTPIFVNHLMWQAGYEGPILSAAHNGGRTALVAVAQQQSFSAYEISGLAQKSAALGNAQEAFDAAARGDPSSAYESYGARGAISWTSQREQIRADMSEIFLLTENLPAAARAAQMAQEAAVPGPAGGWAAVRAQALVLAERGQIEEAVQALQIFYTRRYAEQNPQWGWGWDNGSGDFVRSVWPFEPSSRWSQARFDAIGIVAEYLIWRGRVDAAIQLANQLDTLRAVRLVAYLRAHIGSDTAGLDGLENAILNRAGGGTAFPPERREQIERQITTAVNLSGAAYDLDWWFAWVNRRQIQFDIGGSYPGEPAAQVMALIRAPESLERGLRYVHAAYEYDRYTDARRLGLSTEPLLHPWGR